MLFSSTKRLNICKRVMGYGFLSFAKNMARNIGKNIIKNVRSKYSQKSINQPKQSARDALETASKRSIQKTAEARHKVINVLRIMKHQKIINLLGNT